MKKGYVYILEDESKKYYVGSTSDLKRRMEQHKYGHTQTTRNVKGPKLIFWQEYEWLGTARKVEKRLKNLKRRDYLEKIISDGFLKLKP